MLLAGYFLHEVRGRPFIVSPRLESDFKQVTNETKNIRPHSHQAHEWPGLDHDQDPEGQDKHKTPLLNILRIQFPSSEAKDPEITKLNSASNI